MFNLGTKLLRICSRCLYYLLKPLLRVIDTISPRNFTFLYVNLLKLYGVHFTGAPRYISTKVKFDDFNKITLGERVVISDNVILLTHDYSLTTALISIDKKPETDIAFIKPIIIKENVFIGMNSLIMPGTIINKNVIIGAGSVVRGIIPENSILIGNPSIIVGNIKEKAVVWNLKKDNFELRID
jgi:acetyltransferase-like isoleucine patch superfamily enzyme